MDQEKQKAAESHGDLVDRLRYMSKPQLKPKDCRAYAIHDFKVGADWAIEKMKDKLIADLAMDITAEYKAKCERYEKALRSIGRNAEELNKITNFDTLNAIINTAKEALTEKWDAEEMMKKVSK